MTLNYSKKILLLSVVTFFCMLFLNYVSFSFLIEKVIDINDKVKQLNISSQERERQLNLRDSVANSKVEREKLLGYFVGAGNLETVVFTKYLEDIASQAGVTQSKSLNYEPIAGFPSSETLTSIRFKFNVSGRWANVFTFLQEIENLPKAAALNNVSLNVSTGNTWSADLDFSVAKLKN